jgi:hypothetical protein
LREEEHTVFVLGAGASLAEAIARRPKRSKDHPPLDGTFFRHAADHDDEGLLRRVVGQAKRLGEHNLTGDDPPVSLEAYLGRLFFEMHHNPLRTSTQAYFDAVTLYASEIVGTTNWMMGKGGLIKKVIQKELTAQRDVSIVTFNVDLLAENALQRLTKARPGAEWCLSQTYGFSSLKDPVKYSSPEYKGEFDYAGETAAIKVFKMHGSVNWIFQHRDANPPADLINKERQFYVVTNEKIPKGRSTLKSSGPGRKRWYISPLIVPPVYEKHGFIKRHLQDVWDGASDALRTADRVVFWGYSFPQADTHARHYFQGLSEANSAMKHPITINPDPEAETALWHVLKSRSVGHYRTADDYLADARI